VWTTLDHNMVTLFAVVSNVVNEIHCDTLKKLFTTFALPNSEPDTIRKRWPRTFPHRRTLATNDQNFCFVES
jgi:hypothetical protein